MEITGPLRGTDHVKTKYSTAGTHCRGTNNNCGNGYTPWGTYLTCEENWPGIFVNKGTRPEDQRRIGVGTSSGQYKWESAAGDASEVDDEFARFDVTVKGASATDDHRNETSTYGYIVEIDPYNSSTLAANAPRWAASATRAAPPACPSPASRWCGTWVTTRTTSTCTSGCPPPCGTPLMPPRPTAWPPAPSTSTKASSTWPSFNADGTGVWLLLDVATATTGGSTLGALYGDLPGIILNTRGAGDAVGATPMDRPEWTTVNPLNGDVY